MKSIERTALGLSRLLVQPTGQVDTWPSGHGRAPSLESLGGVLEGSRGRRNPQLEPLPIFGRSQPVATHRKIMCHSHPPQAPGAWPSERHSTYDTFGCPECVPVGRVVLALLRSPRRWQGRAVRVRRPTRAGAAHLQALTTAVSGKAISPSK